MVEGRSLSGPHKSCLTCEYYVSPRYILNYKPKNIGAVMNSYVRNLSLLDRKIYKIRIFLIYGIYCNITAPGAAAPPPLEVAAAAAAGCCRAANRDLLVNTHILNFIL